MRSKPIVMDQFFTVHTSYIVNFTFTNNITILTGDSATGKTASFSFIKECMAINPNILCLNYLDYQKDIKELLNKTRGKLIVIDNAKLVSKYKIVSKFNSVILDIDCLSTGCKTVLNVLYNPEKVFCLKECGINA